jgi:Ca2+-binding RTX toxin-like protein
MSRARRRCSRALTPKCTGLKIERAGTGDGAGNDAIFGGAGIDNITGGAGKDTLSGGADKDTFIYTSASDSAAGVATRDVILDFEYGVDKIGLTALRVTAADINLTKFYAGADSSGAYAQLLRISTQHNGIYDMEIQINTRHMGIDLTLSDIIGLM